MSSDRLIPLRALRTRALLAVVLLAPGCFWFTTKHEGDTLRTDVGDLKSRMGVQEQQVQEKVGRLDESLDKATKLLARNSADVGTEVEKLADEIAKLMAQNDSLRRDVDALRAAADTARTDGDTRVAAVQARLDALEKVTAKPASQPAPVDKDALFDGARAKLEAGQTADARRDFRLFAQKFPADSRVPASVYWVGESFYREKDFEKAIAEYQKIVDVYGASDVADDALLQSGQAALDLKRCLDANAFYGELVRRYPKSELVKTAKTKLDFIKKNRKKADVCVD